MNDAPHHIADWILGAALLLATTFFAALPFVLVHWDMLP